MRIMLTVVATAIVVAALRSRDLRRTVVREMQCSPIKQCSITMVCCESLWLADKLLEEDTEQEAT